MTMGRIVALLLVYGSLIGLVAMVIGIWAGWLRSKGKWTKPMWRNAVAFHWFRRQRIFGDSAGSTGNPRPCDRRLPLLPSNSSAGVTPRVGDFVARFAGRNFGKRSPSTP